MVIAKIPLSELKKAVNPLNGKMWKVPPITVKAVKSAVGENQFIEKPWNEFKKSIPDEIDTPECHQELHIRRIAYLVENFRG